MSGPRRLAVFVSLLWVGLLLLLSSLDEVFRLAFFLVAGVVPVALVWGIWWVAAGFRSDKNS